MRGSVFLRFQDLGKEGLTSTATSRLSCFVFLCQQKSKIRFNWVGQSRYHQLVKSYPSWFTIGTIVTILMIIWKVGCIRLDPHCEEHFGAGLGDVRVPGNHHWSDDQWSLSASSIFPTRIAWSLQLLWPSLPLIMIIIIFWSCHMLFQFKSTLPTSLLISRWTRSRKWTGNSI